MLAGILVIIAVIDIKTMEIPNLLVLMILGIGIVDFFVSGNFTWREVVAGMLCVSIPMFVLDWMIPGAFGGGDIKLCAACGAVIGWKCMLTAFLTALVIGGIYGAVLLILKKKSRGEYFAFGPFLAVGIITVIFSASSL